MALVKLSFSSTLVESATPLSWNSKSQCHAQKKRGRVQSCKGPLSSCYHSHSHCTKQRTKPTAEGLQPAANGGLQKGAKQVAELCREGSETVRAMAASLLAAAVISQGVTNPEAAQALAFPCENVDGYYAPTKGLSGPALKAKLHEIIAGHKVYSYAQVWDALKVLDAADEQDPVASPDVMEIYSQRRVAKDLAAKPEGWNREHLWPRSYGLLDKTPQFSDLHNLRPADVNVNSARGNKYYGECSGGGNGTCQIPANQEAASDTATDRVSWTPPSKVRGDIARALFYMAVRYEGEEPGTLDLELDNNPSISEARMGLLSTLLKWSAADPPSPSEKLRNSRVCAIFQHNRNPFVDHPEFAALLWGPGVQAGPIIAQPIQPEPAKPLLLPAWINELHYENAGGDQGEFVEVAVGPGVDPAQLEVLLYNGADGKVYRTLSLKDSTDFRKGEVLPGGVVLYWAPVAGVQNGPADGVALVMEGRVLQLLSYQGVFTAANGPAEGQLSTDVKARETGNTKPGTSIGLAGPVPSGELSSWMKLCPATPGQANSQSPTCK